MRRGAGFSGEGWGKLRGRIGGRWVGRRKG